MPHYAGDLILTELTKESGVPYDELRERVNVGAEDFADALLELEAQGAAARGGHDGSLVYLADARAGSSSDVPEPEVPPAAGNGVTFAGGEAGAGTPPDGLHLAASLGALLAGEAQASGRRAVVRAEVRFEERADGQRVVTEVLQIHGIDLT